MRRTLIAVAAVSAASLASSAFAGFSFTTTDGGIVGGFQVYTIRAINDGVGTGTELDGYDLTYTLNAGNMAKFLTYDADENGTADTADLLNTSQPAAFGYLRVGNAATTSIVSTSPALGPVEPNQWASLNTWSIAAISTGSEAATGTGAIIAKLFISGANPGGLITGQIGGNTGDAVPVNYAFGGSGPQPNVAPVVSLSQNSVSIDIASQTAFGPVTASATDADNNLATFAAGAVPATIADNISITGSGTGPYTINGSGFTAADVGTWTIDFTATDSGNPSLSDMDTFTLTVTNSIPEPTTLAALAGFGLLALRRRK